MADSLVYDSQMLQAIEDLLTTAERYDLVDYLRYLEDTLTSLDEVDYSTDEEESYDIGMTHDGFYYLK